MFYRKKNTKKTKKNIASTIKIHYNSGNFFEQEYNYTLPLVEREF